MQCYDIADVVCHGLHIEVDLSQIGNCFVRNLALDVVPTFWPIETQVVFDAVEFNAGMDLGDFADVLHDDGDVVVKAVVEAVLDNARELAGNRIRREQNAGFQGFDVEPVVGSAVVVFARSGLVDFRRRRNRLRILRAGK